jgi:selenide,water dikinase
MGKGQVPKLALQPRCERSCGTPRRKGGALEVLGEANTALVGGHTGEGAELALGFAINGLVEAANVLCKGGMQPGDRLILTKALGTGALFAADMRHKAKGPWIAAAVDSMLQSNREGAQCLHRYQATACTDVTGFGLLGHLIEMTKSADVDAELDLNTIPSPIFTAVRSSDLGWIASEYPRG